MDKKTTTIKKYLFFLSILVIPLISALIIVDGGCNVGETEMFSIYQREDSHVGQAGFFNLSVCYPGLINITLEETCSAGACIFSQFKQNDTHIAECGWYNYSLCIEGPTCEIGATCYREHKLISINKFNNSHIGEFGYYPIVLCCGDVIRGIGGGPEAPLVEIEEEIEVTEVKKIEEQIIPIIKKNWYWGLSAFFIYLILGRRRKRKCHKCKMKFKRKKLNLYKRDYYCNKCFEQLNINKNNMNKKAEIDLFGIIIVALIITFLYFTDLENIGGWFDAIVEFSVYIGALIYPKNSVYGLLIIFGGLFMLFLLKNRYEYYLDYLGDKFQKKKRVRKLKPYFLNQ